MHFEILIKKDFYRKRGGVINIHYVVSVCDFYPFKVFNVFFFVIQTVA